MTKEEVINYCEDSMAISEDDDGRYHNEVLEFIIKVLKQEPKTGHWILLDECSNSGYYCSECHKKVVKEGWSDTVKKVKYCPNCGAKMEDER